MAEPAGSGEDQDTLGSVGLFILRGSGPNHGREDRQSERKGKKTGRWPLFHDGYLLGTPELRTRNIMLIIKCRFGSPTQSVYT
jgi:hypothetical protein